MGDGFLEVGVARELRTGVPWWLSGLRTRHCHYCGSGYCSGIGLIPSLETSRMPWVWPKNKKKKEEEMTLRWRSWSYMAHKAMWWAQVPKKAKTKSPFWECHKAVWGGQMLTHSPMPCTWKGITKKKLKQQTSTVLMSPLTPNPANGPSLGSWCTQTTGDLRKATYSQSWIQSLLFTIHHKRLEYPDWHRERQTLVLWMNEKDCCED